MKNEAISVIMPVHNGSQYLVESIESVLKQSFRSFELIIIDDGSTDNTLDIISRYSDLDRRVKGVALKKAGIVKALNTGIELSTGRFIARMDADDICHPERFSTQIDYLASNTLDLCGCSIEQFGVSKGVKRFPVYHDELVANILTYGKSLAHPTVFAKSEVYKQFSYPSSFPNAEDFALWLNIALNSSFKLGNCPDTLLRYRVHKGQVSKEKKQSQLLSTSQAVIHYLSSVCPELTERELLANSLIARQREWLKGDQYIDHISFLEKLKIFLKTKEIDTLWLDKAIIRICKRSVAFKNFPLDMYFDAMSNPPTMFDRYGMKLKVALKSSS